MANRDHNYLIECAASVETDKSVGKLNDTRENKIVANAMICGAFWFFIQSHIIHSQHCDVRLDDHLISFTIGLVISLFLGAFITSKYIDKKNDEWYRRHKTILDDLKNEYN